MDFLKKLSQIYEIVIFTAATKEVKLFPNKNILFLLVCGQYSRYFGS
jgi:TFIIF-interacting CTD phosphatase-like protein